MSPIRTSGLASIVAGLLLIVTGCATPAGGAGTTGGVGPADRGTVAEDDSSLSAEGRSTPDGSGSPGGLLSAPPLSRSAAPTAQPGPSPRALPAPSPLAPVPGTRVRRAQWTLAGPADGGRVLLLDVSVGGPPCDVVTGVDTAETARSVTVTVHAGVPAGATCTSGAPARLGTARIAVRLAEPLGARKVVGP